MLTRPIVMIKKKSKKTLKEKPQWIAEAIEKKQTGTPEESIHNAVQRKQEMAVGELGDRKTEWEGLTQREKGQSTHKGPTT